MIEELFRLIFGLARAELRVFKNEGRSSLLKFVKINNWEGYWF